MGRVLASVAQLCTEGLEFNSLVRPQAEVLDLIPRGGVQEATDRCSTLRCMFLSL